MIFAKANQDFQLTINSKQKHFGVKNFDVKVVDLASGQVTKQNVDVEEVIEQIENPASAKTAQDALAGQRTIKVTDSTLADGMVFKDPNGNMYYIESVDTDNGIITTKVPLKEDIPANSTLTQVGNTGIYKVPLNIANPGKYNVVISNPEVNLRNLAAFVEVFKFDIDDIGDKIDTQTQAILDKIQEIKSAIANQDDSDYEVVS